MNGEHPDKRALPTKEKIAVRWTCSDFVHHAHRWRWSARVCGLWQQRDRLLWLLLPERLYRKLPDHCETCGGTRGGVRGNENIVKSCGERIVMCDYCSADEMRWPGFWKEPRV